jgi:uncharacterized protein YgiM (DUF1202 family)
VKTIPVTALMGAAFATMASNLNAGVFRTPAQPMPSLYQTVAEKQMTVRAVNGVNLRKTNGQVLAKLKHGTKVTVIGISSTWAHVRVGNMEGYVSSQFLK